MNPYKTKLYLGEDYDDPSGTEAYCTNCGKKTKAKEIRRVPEYYDAFQGRLIKDWVSECCQDELSEDPITDVCAMCGETADFDEHFEFVEGDRMCPGCKQDYRRDHPDMEEEIARAEWQLSDR